MELGRGWHLLSGYLYPATFGDAEYTYIQSIHKAHLDRTGHYIEEETVGSCDPA